MSKRQLFVPTVVSIPRIGFVWPPRGCGSGTGTGDGSSPVQSGVTYAPWDDLPRSSTDTDRDIAFALVEDEVVL